jgi:small subunit ribosomal protein S6
LPLLAAIVQKEVLLMAEITAKYELVIITKADLDEETTAALVTKFKDLIAANGTVDAVDEWGKRRLAYPINDEAEGYYVQINFTSGNEFPAELDRQLKINDAILRSLIVRPGK